MVWRTKAQIVRKPREERVAQSRKGSDATVGTTVEQCSVLSPHCPGCVMAPLSPYRKEKQQLQRIPQNEWEKCQGRRSLTQVKSRKQQMPWEFSLAQLQIRRYSPQKIGVLENLSYSQYERSLVRGWKGERASPGGVCLSLSCSLLNPKGPFHCWGLGLGFFPSNSTR